MNTLPDNDWYAEHLQIDRWPGSGPARHVVIGDCDCAMPQDAARALVLRNQSLRLFSLRASVAIAALCVLIFGGQLIRGWLS